MKTKRTCANGHTYFKSSDCPVCPKCESRKVTESELLQRMPAPARRALQHEGINTLKDLTQWNRKDLLALHGLGPHALRIMEQKMKEQDLKFKS